jgi:hypothetical protein
VIQSEGDLQAVREQLRLVEDALIALHRDVWPQNPRNYATLAEAYVDMILELRGQIDAYLGIAPAPARNADHAPGLAAEQVPVATGDGK